MLPFPSKRIALRRASPCGTVGRLSRGFAQANVQRVGDTSDAGAGRANIKRAGIYRVGEVPTCGCPVVNYTNDYATENSISSGLALNVAIEIADIPFNTFGTCPLTISATVDAKVVAAGHPIFDGFIALYVAPPGEPSNPSPDFANNQLTSLEVGGLTVAYANYNLGSISFTPTGGPLSLYLWPPVEPPAFAGSNLSYKNLHVHIVTT